MKYFCKACPTKRTKFRKSLEFIILQFAAIDNFKYINIQYIHETSRIILDTNI